MSPFDPSGSTLRGHLLVAHPALRDPNFCRTIVLISAHSAEDGAVGVITNRPLGKTLGELKADFRNTMLGDLPVFEGGPVAVQEILLVAWRWDALEGSYHLHFGISADTLEGLLRDDPGMRARAFLGYAGWGEGQVEGELNEKAWIVVPLQRAYLESEARQVWRAVVRSERPELGFLADAPEDPSLN